MNRKLVRLANVMIALVCIVLPLLSSPVAHAQPVAYATPQPAYCAVQNTACEAHQPWVAVGSQGSDSGAVASGVRATITFSIPNSNIIQTDNELGAGIAVYAPSLLAENTWPVGRDYEYFGFVNVDNGGSVSFVSSVWINCEWSDCSACSNWPTCTQVSQSQQSDCLTGANGWNTCIDGGHWQLWHDRFNCSACTTADTYIVEMVWVNPSGGPNPYVWWNYYRNGVIVHTAAFAQNTGWQVGTYFKYGSAPVSCTQCYWYHYQFGVTSLYDIGTTGWQVTIAYPEYRGTDNYTWYLVPSAFSAGGGYTSFDDARYLLGGLNYPGVSVTPSTGSCQEQVTFSDVGGTVVSIGQSLWSSINTACSFPFGGPDFSIASNPTTISICPGTSNGPAISLQSVNGFTGTVNLYAPPPQGFAWTSFNYNPLTLASGGTAITGLQIAPGGASTGTYTIPVSGVNGGVFHSVTQTVIVTFSACSGGGGGSVASGSLISLASGKRIPVQNIRVGDEVIVYNVPTEYQTVATVYQVQSVVVNNTLTIETTAGGPPFRADANPHMKLWVLTPSGPVEKPITTISTGDKIYNYDMRSWVGVTDVTITYGGLHTMYDVLTTPNFTSNGLILEVIANGYPDCGARGCKESPSG